MEQEECPKCGENTLEYVGATEIGTITLRQYKCSNCNYEENI